MNNIEITPKELKSLLTQKNNIILLDVRTKKEIEIASIGGINIPIDELSIKITSLNKKSHIIIYCHHGIRSLKAVRILQYYGFKQVQHLKNGINAWSDIVDPSIRKY